MERTGEILGARVEPGSRLWLDAVGRNFSRDWGRYEEHVTNRGLQFHTSYLPHYESFLRRQDFMEVLSSGIRKNGRAAILDVGCGVGQALADIKDQFGDSVETWGLSASDLASRKTISKIDNYIVSEVHDTQQIPEARFDVITAYQSFRYFADPVYVFERSWKWLKSGGFGFIDSVGSGGVPVYWLGLRVPTSEFVKLAKSCGYDFSQDMRNEMREHDVVFRKGERAELKLPIERSEIFEDSELVFKVKYRWVGKVPKNIARDIMDANERERVRNTNPSVNSSINPS